MAVHAMVMVLQVKPGPRISLGPENRLVEQYSTQDGGSRVGPAAVIAADDKMCVGCTTISADAVEFLIKKWREKHPAPEERF